MSETTEQNLEKEKDVINKIKLRQEVKYNFQRSRNKGSLVNSREQFASVETEAPCSEQSWSWDWVEITFEEVNFLGASMQGEGVIRWQERKCAIQGQWLLLLLWWLSTIESVNKVEVRSHQRGREWRYWEEGCVCALRSLRNGRDLVSIKALSADLMGINADGMCSTGRKSWWIEREKGNEKKKRRGRGRQRRGKGSELHFCQSDKYSIRRCKWTGDRGTRNNF